MSSSASCGDPVSHPLRLAVAGCGRVFERFHARALRRRTGWTLVAGCDPQDDARARLRKLEPAARTFETLDALLDSCELDAVLVAAPPALHAPLALSALARGKHVLVEKPLALSVADGERMVATARDAGVVLWVGCQRRFAPSSRRIAAWLAGRVPHDVLAMSFETRSNPRRWGSYSPFLGDDARGGSALLDLAPHQLDLLAWLIDGYPSAVRAQSSDQGVRYDVRWPSGVVASCAVGHGPVNRDCLTIRLTDCVLVRTGASAGRFRLPGRWRTACLKMRRAPVTLLRRVTGRGDGQVDAFAAQLAAFGEAVRGSAGQARVTDGLATLSAIEACRSSLAAGGAWQPIAAR
jgi:predicted dehydrogenase